jgi:hypothetical protein
LLLHHYFGVLLLSLTVQTYFGQKSYKARINADYGTNINIERIGLRFNGDVELGVYIEDYK